MNEDTGERALLTDAERRQMWADIADVSLLVGASLFPARTWNDIDVAHVTRRAGKSPAERLRFLCRMLPALTQAMEEWARCPSVRLLRETRTVVPERARRVPTPALQSAARRGLPLRSVEEAVSMSTRDTPEGRAVRSFLHLLHDDAEAIGRMAAQEGEADAARAAEQCAFVLRGLLQFSVWQDVREDGAALSQMPGQMGTSPAARQIAQFMHGYGAAFCLDWNAPAFSLPPRAAWQIYETWTAFTAMQVLLALNYTPQPEGQTVLAVRRDRLCPTLETGQASLLRFCGPGGRRVTLTFQPTFAAGERSRGRTLRPDLTLENKGQLFILDAKWKEYALPGDEGDDMNQMHAYRDAIVGTRGEGIVRRAWCLFPGALGGPRRSVICYGPAEESIVGAVCLRPGSADYFARLCTLLSGWLGA